MAYAACRLSELLRWDGMMKMKFNLLYATNYRNNVCRYFNSPVDCPIALP
jgi:hypothetical protein